MKFCSSPSIIMRNSRLSFFAIFVILIVNCYAGKHCPDCGKLTTSRLPDCEKHSDTTCERVRRPCSCCVTCARNIGETCSGRTPRITEQRDMTATGKRREKNGIMDDLSQRLPCRKFQIKFLLSMFGKREQMTVPSLFIYGHTGTGKSMVVNTVLQTLGLPHVLINCIECYSSRFLYETILNHFHGSISYHRDTTSLMKCDNMNDFVRMFHQVLEERGLNEETVYIILDKAERLREMDANILPAFLRLQELTNQNVCVVLLTEIVWEKFRTGTGYCEPLVLHFPDYNRDELIEIMCQSPPVGYSEDFYRTYLSLVLGVFQFVCRDLIELQHLASINFKKYTEPLESLRPDETPDARKLWKNVEPHLKKALQTVYLREISSLQWEKIQENTENTQLPLSQAPSSRTHVELPYYSKFLLIAAYLASYNPAKSDKRFFVKLSGKAKKSKIERKHERTSNHMLGPKPFPMDRLLAIFYSICEGKVAPTANIFMQISSLTSLHLLSQVAGEEQIDVPKYKCLVSLDFIKSVARTVGFDVMRYLYDFV